MNQLANHSRAQQLRLVHILLQADFASVLFMAVPKLSAKRVVTMDDMQKSGEPAKDILAKLQRDRGKRGEDGPGRLAVCDFLSGKIHRRDIVENRGRPSQMPRRLVSSVAPRCEGGAIRQLSDNYQTTIRQLSDNYQTTIRQIQKYEVL